jgi:KDO2-lipid IV(A) lauroyltransferase
MERLVLLLVRCLGAIPLSLRSSIGAAVGYSIGMLPLKERRIAEAQLRRFLPKVDAKRIARRVFMQIGRSAFETLNFACCTENLDTYFEGQISPQVVEKIHSRKHIIALSAHVGNWELLAAYLSAIGLPIVTFARRARLSFAQTILAEMRKRSNVETIWRNDAGGGKAMVSAFKRGKVIASLIDQDTRVPSLFTPFFGTAAATPHGVVAFAKRTEATIATFFIVRLPGPPLKFRIVAEEIDNKLSVDEIMEEYHRRLEKLIREFPDQWVWFHARWRTTVQGDRRSTTHYITDLEREISKDPQR